MIDKGKGSIIVTGNTSAHRGKANFGGTASTKAAQKILTESMKKKPLLVFTGLFNRCFLNFRKQFMSKSMIRNFLTIC